MSSPYQKALEAGYSPEEINSFLSKKDPRYERAIQMGHSPEEIQSFMQKKGRDQSFGLQSTDFEEDSGLEREIERNQAQMTSRILERLGGLPGDIYSIVPDYIKKMYVLDPLLKRLPTSSQLQDISEKATLGYTKPQTKFEEKVGEFTGDVGAGVIGGAGRSLFGTMARTIGVPLAGALAKEGIEKIGGSTPTQHAAKLGTMLLLDLWGLRRGAGGGALNFGRQRLQDARQAIPQGAMADVQPLVRTLDRIEEDLRRGITGPQSSEALRAIGEIREHIAGGQMEASLFPRLREDINKLIDNMKGFTLQGPPRNIRRAAVRNLNRVKDAVITAGNRWGRRNSPEFFRAWREGNEALSVFHRSRDISNFIGRHTKIKNPILRAMFGMEALKHPTTGIPLWMAKKGLYLGTKGAIGLAYRYLQSPVLRRLYSNILSQAARRNASAVSRGVQAMEKKMDQEEREED